jgi:acylphosphatase
VKKLTADVFGIVQGVGFRYFVNQQADLLGVDASAENMPDGTVHVVAYGDEGQLRQLVAALRRGSRFALVKRVNYGIEDAPQ